MSLIHSPHRFSPYLCFCLLFLCITKSLAMPVVQIQGDLRTVSGNPRWLILLRNPDNGSTTPWMYDVKQAVNHWVILPGSHAYQIVASELLFNDRTIFHNFCGIEDGVITGKSMQITLSGQLSPTTDTIRCHVISYPYG